MIGDPQVSDQYLPGVHNPPCDEDCCEPVLMSECRCADEEVEMRLNGWDIWVQIVDRPFPRPEGEN